MKDLCYETAFERSGICLIVNDRSGHCAATEQNELLQIWLGGQPGRRDIIHSSSGTDPATAARQAVRAGYATVVAVGGDGTISAVAGQIARSGVRLGVVPTGTFNYFARGLGIPSDPAAALDVIAQGHARPVAVGEVNGRLFLNNASLGAYPAILDQREGIYRRWGRSRLAAHWSTLQALLSAYRPQRMKVSVDGQVLRVRTPLVFVANSAYQLDQFGLEGADAVRAGRFALFVAEDCGRLKMVEFALKLAFGKMRVGQDVTMICGSEIMIEPRGGQRLVARDGEKEPMAPPFRFRRHDDALEVLVPPERGAKAA